MSVTYFIKDGVVIFVPAGQYGLDDLKAAYDAALSDPGFVTPMQIFVDARESRVNPPIEELRESAKFFGSMRPHFCEPWVIVVSEPLRYGLARMLSVFVEAYGLNIQVFRDTEEAWVVLQNNVENCG